MIALLDRTMLAIKKTENRPGLTWTTETPVPTVGPREVLVSVTHAGICGTDRHIYEWDAWSRSRVPLGVTIGHEFVGRVVAVGDAVVRTKIGDRVSAEGHVGCGACQACRTGNAHICDSVSILGIDRNGGFAQFVAVPEENIWPVHPNIPDEIAAILDPLGNAMHTVMAAGVSGRSVLITGVGTIGLMAVAIARAAGASKVIVTDTNAHHLDVARQLGADLALSALDDTWPEQVKQATGNIGPQALLEMSGSPRAIRQGLRTVRNGGTVALLGIPSQKVELDLPNDIIFKGLTVLGVNGRKMFETWYQVEELLLSGRIDLRPIITHQFELPEFDRAVQAMQSGEAIKVVLRVPHEDYETCQTAASTSAPARF